MKRQRGRNRGGGGGSGGGGGKPQHNANRAFDSNGPENIKVRGNAQHVFEKYQQLARDAQTLGDRVLAENYLQHAEHYFRLLRAMQPQRPASEILGRDQFASGYDIDFEDEGAQAQAAEADAEAYAAEGEGGEPRERWQGREDRPRDERPREDRFRDDRPREERARDDRPRDERPRDDRPRDDRPRDDRPRGDRESRRDRWREDRPRHDRQGGDQPRPERDPMAVVEPESTPLPTSEDRGQVLRDADGGESHAPAFLQSRPAPPPADPEAVAKPRRRRAPRSFEGGAETAAPSAETEEA